MSDWYEHLIAHSRLAVFWLLLGAGIGATICYYHMKDSKRPVVEIRLDPRVSSPSSSADAGR